MAAYLSTLSDVEVIVRALKSGLSKANFDDELHALADAGELTLATKAEFYSPGDIWVQLAGGTGSFFSKHEWMAAVVLAYSLIFGNSKLGFDGILDLATRQKIRDLMLARLEKRKMDKVVERLGATVPTKKTTALESMDEVVRNRD